VALDRSQLGAGVPPRGGGAFWDGGAETFVHKGVNGRWRDTLTAEDSTRYEALARERLGADCAQWLATGAR
jgi:aryl sulfotransferase